MNGIACLWLTQRCADILICVMQEVQDADGDVCERSLLINLLRAFFLPFLQPYMCLSSVTDVFCGHRLFDMVYQFLQKQVERPFLKRYLQ
jgi:abelson tyrosine-protein kinase 1